MIDTIKYLEPPKYLNCIRDQTYNFPIFYPCGHKKSFIKHICTTCLLLNIDIPIGRIGDDIDDNNIIDRNDYRSIMINQYIKNRTT